MEKPIRVLSIDTTSLPAGEAVYQKLFPIVKKRIEDRCAAVCAENIPAEFTLRFVLDDTLPEEAFSLADEKAGIVIRGASFLALLYGAGQFLHKSRYIAEGVIPTLWRGMSVPQNPKRVIQLEQHFFNYYQCCSEEELREQIEDLALWGLNGVSSVFSCLNLTSWDDPSIPNLVKILRCMLSTAKELTLKAGIEFSNVDFMNPRQELRADYKYLLSKTGNLICPSTEGGYEYIEELFGKILSFVADIGLDFIVYIAYDEGGCSCDKCWPWAGRGYYDMTRRLSKFAKQHHPNLEFWLFTWYVGRGDDHRNEWPSLYQRLREDAAKGDEPHALIVDFFSGSGTTLHAVNLLNAEDGGKRRCIMVTNNEVSAEEAKTLSAQGYQPGDAEWEKLGIAKYVTWPRTVCSIEGHDVNGNPLKGNYLGSDRPMADGFKANAAFFKLGFLDKTSVALGRQFKEMLPTLWMKAGAYGPCPKVGEETPDMLILPQNKFAVLANEASFEEFAEKVNAMQQIETVYIVTDYEIGYRSMIKNIAAPNTYQLYRDYLDNFRINTGRN